MAAHYELVRHSIIAGYIIQRCQHDIHHIYNVVHAYYIDYTVQLCNLRHIVRIVLHAACTQYTTHTSHDMRRVHMRVQQIMVRHRNIEYLHVYSSKCTRIYLSRVG